MRIQIVGLPVYTVLLFYVDPEYIQVQDYFVVLPVRIVHMFHVLLEHHQVRYEFV